MKKIFRDRWDKKIGGVCGGIGLYLKIDPTLIRLLFVFLCIITGILPILIIYLIGWMFIPLGPVNYIQHDHGRLYRSVRDRKIAGICGGISSVLKIDPLIIRIVALISLFITGFFPIAVTYILGILIIPEDPKNKV